MKKSTKIVLILGGCLIGGGLLLMLCGWLTGGRSGLVYYEGAWRPAVYDTGWSETVREDETFAGVESLSVSLSLGELELREDKGLDAGDVRVVYALPRELSTSMAVEQGTLRFESSGEFRRDRPRWGIGNWFFSWGRNRGYQEASVNIYYGPGTVFDRADITAALGNITIYGMEVNALELEDNLGEVVLKGVNAAKTADLTLSAGNLEAKDCRLGQAQIDCAMGNIEASGIHTAGLTASANMGSVDLSGVLEGDIQVQCDMGSIFIDTELPRSAYRLDLTASMGSVEVDGYDGSSLREDNPGAANTIEGRCSMGSIEVYFSRY